MNTKLMIEYFRDSHGRIIGNVRDDGRRKTYSDEKGRFVAFVTKDSAGNERTLDAHGKYVGTRDQGVSLLQK